MPSQPRSPYQAWAGYLEGDNISTKIGSSRVEIEIGEASPIFQEIEIGIGEALVKSRVGSGASGFYSRGVETSRDNSRSRGKTRLSRFFPDSRIIPTFFVGISRDVEISRDFRSPNDLENRAKSREKSRKSGDFEIISKSPGFSTFPDLSRVVSMNLEKNFLHPDQSGRSGVPDLDNLDASG